MAEGPQFYVNGIDRTLNQSIAAMRRYHARYVTVGAEAAESLFTGPEAVNVNEFSPRELRDRVFDRMRAALDPERAGRLPVRGRDGKTRYYDPQSWSETIARTRSRDLQEEGLHNEMIRAGFDLVIVSGGRVAHELCANWEQRILSVTGKTPGYPTIAEARRTGLFHPRCVHTTSPVILVQEEVPELIGRDRLPNKAKAEIRRASDWAIFPTGARRRSLSKPAPATQPNWAKVREELRLDLRKTVPQLEGTGAITFNRQQPIINLDVNKIPVTDINKVLRAINRHDVRVQYRGGERTFVGMPRSAFDDGLPQRLDTLGITESPRTLTRRVLDRNPDGSFKNAPDEWLDQFNVGTADSDVKYAQFGTSRSRANANLTDELRTALRRADDGGAARAIAKTGYQDIDDLMFVGRTAESEIAIAGQRAADAAVPLARQRAARDTIARRGPIKELYDELDGMGQQYKDHAQANVRLSRRLRDGEITGDEYDRLWEVLRDEFEPVKARYLEIQAETTRLQAEARATINRLETAQATGVRDALSEYRSFGTRQRHRYAPDSDDFSIKKINDAQELYPTDWVEPSIRASRDNPMGVVRNHERGKYDPREQRIHLDSRTDSISLDIHETAHRLEQHNPNILRWEKEFYDRRTAGESPVPMQRVRPQGNYDPREVTRVDEWSNPYIGKDYGENFYELLSMGAEGIYTPQAWSGVDLEFEEFVIGLLAGG